MAEQLNVALLTKRNELHSGTFLLDPASHLQDSEQLYHETNEAWEAGDLDRLAQAARTLKEDASSICALQLSDYCDELENAAKRRLGSRIPELLNRIAFELREMRDAAYVVSQSC